MLKAVPSVDNTTIHYPFRRLEQRERKFLDKTCNFVINSLDSLGQMGQSFQKWTK